MLVSPHGKYFPRPGQGHQGLHGCLEHHKRLGTKNRLTWFAYERIAASLLFIRNYGRALSADVSTSNIINVTNSV